MRVVIFAHSFVSDWNHGNAHFLRGVAGEFIARGCDVELYEPWESWSRQNLLETHGLQAWDDFEREFPELQVRLYHLDGLELERILCSADLVLVHEWNDPQLVARIGEHRAKRGDYQLFFHDTHHRCVTDQAALAAFDLRHYDGVLAFGDAIRRVYNERKWCRNAWTWHEAADTRRFYPRCAQPAGDLVWIGNWGDDERADELREYLIEPVKRLKLKARVYGVRYPRHAIDELCEAGIQYAGWLPNHRVPEVFASFRVTVHIPRRPYSAALPGVPTIRPFEAMACGIPLLSAPWDDCEQLFRANQDFLVAGNGDEMTELLAQVIANPSFASEMAEQGLATIRSRHTCRHRIQELLGISQSLMTSPAATGVA